MTKTMDGYFNLYRQKRLQIAERKQTIADIMESAESAIRTEAVSIDKLQKELRSMQRTITVAIETGKDLTEVLLSESDTSISDVSGTIWDEDDIYTVNDTQIGYQEYHMEDLKHRLKNAARNLT